MTQEEKQLLLIDLSARLPYNVVIRCTDNDTDYKCFLTTDILNEILHNFEYYDYKPYLRPMESMTEEEGKELEDLFCEIDAPCWVDTKYGCVNFAGGNDFIDTEMAEVYTDWLNAHHFDYRGLIPMGLALEAPKGMY